MVLLSTGSSLLPLIFPHTAVASVRCTNVICIFPCRDLHGVGAGGGAGPGPGRIPAGVLAGAGPGPGRAPAGVLMHEDPLLRRLRRQDVPRQMLEPAKGRRTVHWQGLQMLVLVQAASS